MAKLILSFENTVLKTFALNKERMTIGRRPENDIQVDNLAVSGEHAVIVTVQNDSVIEDLNSTNGTLVNGQAVRKQLLRHNDVIEIGKHKLKYVAEISGATVYPNFAKTMVIRKPDAATQAAPAPPVQAPAPPPPLAAAPAPAPAPAQANQANPPRVAALQILSGANAGKILELTKNLTTVGKPGVQVAVFTRRPMGFFLAHVEGESFPLFNGEPLGPQARQLNDNDTIEIAGIKMSFFYKT
ncbi:MAG TPA: FHA domain-containing protein [Paucimonas sp.]|nr:FHA domain-containing protein [Paucimonas sp.]